MYTNFLLGAVKMRTRSWEDEVGQMSSWKNGPKCILTNFWNEDETFTAEKVASIEMLLLILYRPKLTLVHLAKVCPILSMVIFNTKFGVI
jgi:hypothetical protein